MPILQEIHPDNVVVNYEGAPQVISLKKPDYFKGGVDSAPVTKSKKDAGLIICIWMIIWC
jgi:general secretion pathway protein C